MRDRKQDLCRPMVAGFLRACVVAEPCVIKSVNCEGSTSLTDPIDLQDFSVTESTYANLVFSGNVRRDIEDRNLGFSIRHPVRVGFLTTAPLKSDVVIIELCLPVPHMASPGQFRLLGDSSLQDEHKSIQALKQLQNDSYKNGYTRRKSEARQIALGTRSCFQV
ncbi:hypothetical protein BDP55DRAFT_630997 [Colletotrichum godetiae]|uniref:Uncharacterized protein n=1 Tax=Colletotrichum godetiae TaxID=1209918 RepID=A0AAJ0EX30_9PEZI|nr:uncharacterized protein BDP55DRAFT_630997 [Colletotrichum godetiae]KAK1676913.1 hypothetical protein BDP55DRAFT_630997 [Colletotrichum godetiae]